MVVPCQVQVCHVSVGHRQSLEEQLGYTKISTRETPMAKKGVDQVLRACACSIRAGFQALPGEEP